MSDEDSVEAHEILSTFPDAALPILSTQQQQCDHDKHFFVFSSAGKPIYSYRGDEESLSSLMATAKALLSVAESRSESLRYIRRGHLVISFLDRSPLCLVATSLLAEPPAVLRMQLSLIHGQLISLLTASAIKNIFNKSPGFDIRRLLGNADSLLDSLIDTFTSAPAALLGAYPTLPLPQSIRSMVLKELHAATTTSNALFGILVSKGRVVALVSTANEHLQQWDVLLLLNFLHSHESLKQAETLVPVCLPTYNANGHLHAFISFMENTPDLALMMLTGGGAPDVHAMYAAKKAMMDGLYDRGVLDPLLKATDGLRDVDGGILSLVQIKERTRAVLTETARTPPSSTPPSFSALSLASPSRAPPQQQYKHSWQHIVHFAYKLTRVQQFVMSPMDYGVDIQGDREAGNDDGLLAHVHTVNHGDDGGGGGGIARAALFTSEDHKHVIRACEINVAYSQLRASMFDHAGEHVSGPLQTCRVEKRKNCTIVAFSSQESELYMTFDPGVKKNEAVVVATELHKWLQSQHALFFFPPIISSS